MLGWTSVKSCDGNDSHFQDDALPLIPDGFLVSKPKALIVGTFESAIPSSLREKRVQYQKLVSQNLDERALIWFARESSLAIALTGMCKLHNSL